jgi:HAMP domain-containing protein
MADPVPEKLNLKDASERSGVSIKTLRRAIVAGTLAHTQELSIKGQPRYMVTLADVYTLWPPKRTPRDVPLSTVLKISERLRTDPRVKGQGADVEALSDEIKRLTESVDSMARELAQAKHESQELRSEIAEMRDVMSKALPAPGQTSAPRPWWQFWKG